MFMRLLRPTLIPEGLDGAGRRPRRLGWVRNRRGHLQPRARALAAHPTCPRGLLQVFVLRCNELHRYAVHGACSTLSLLHARGMLAYNLCGSRHLCWQVLRAQRRPDDLIDLGCRCSNLPLAPPCSTVEPVHRADRAMCLAGRFVARAARPSYATTGTSINKLSERLPGECLPPSPPPLLTPPALCTCEADAKGDRGLVLAGVRLTRAGGRLLELTGQPGQVGLNGSCSSGRVCRPHTCTLVCTCAYGTGVQAQTIVLQRVSTSGSRRLWTLSLCMYHVRTVLVPGCE